MAGKPKAKKKSKEKKVTITNEHTSPTFYSNYTGIHITNTEITFKLYEILFMDPDELKLKEIGSVVMSPPHAKSVYNLLGKSLEIFDEKLAALIKVTAKEST